MRTKRDALWPLAAIAIPVGSLLITMVSASQWTGPFPLTSLARAQFHTRMLLTEAVLVAVMAPVAGIVSSRQAGRRRAWTIAGPLIAGAVVLVLTSGLLALLLQTPFEASELWASRAMLFAAALALAALGTFCATTFRDVLDSAACAVGVACLVATGVFVAGPGLSEVPAWLLQGALFVNPIVTTAASAHIDIFRTELLYQLSPLAHIQFDYPATGRAFTGYVLIAGVLFAGTAHQVRRKLRGFSSERMFA